MYASLKNKENMLFLKKFLLKIKRKKVRDYSGTQADRPIESYSIRYISGRLKTDPFQEKWKRCCS